MMDNLDFICCDNCERQYNDEDDQDWVEVADVTYNGIQEFGPDYTTIGDSKHYCSVECLKESLS